MWYHKISDNINIVLVAAGTKVPDFVNLSGVKTTFISDDNHHWPNQLWILSKVLMLNEIYLFQIIYK